MAHVEDILVLWENTWNTLREEALIVTLLLLSTHDPWFHCFWAKYGEFVQHECNRTNLFTSWWIEGKERLERLQGDRRETKKVWKEGKGGIKGDRGGERENKGKKERWWKEGKIRGEQGKREGERNMGFYTTPNNTLSYLCVIPLCVISTLKVFSASKNITYWLKISTEAFRNC